MKKILLSTVAALIAFTSVFAQNPKKDRCGTTHWLKNLEAANPTAVAQAFESSSVQMEKALQKKKSAVPNNLKQNAVYTIPVVFHIVTPNPASITDAQILLQLDRLNKDWAGLNADSTMIPSQFKPLYAKGNIQFCLAQRDPQSFPTSGITRKTSNVQSTYDTGDPVKYASAGGVDQWDANKYVNIWVTVIGGTDGILGYATFPGMNSFPANEQGVVIDYQTLPNGTPPYDLGRTLTHEMGHYFLLFHPFDPNGCSGSDFQGTPSITDDTPAQTDPTYGCPNGIVATGCTPADPNGRNYQNFMDYANDACMHMFTVNQMKRAEAALVGLRNSLTTSNGCSPPVLVANNAILTGIVTPDGINSLCASSSPIIVNLFNGGTNPLTSVTFNILVNGVSAGNLNWTGTLAPLASQQVTLPVTNFPNATNNLVVYTNLPNGVADQDVSNDTAKATVNVAPKVGIPYTEGFEGTAFPPAGWDRIQTPVDGVTWQRTTTASKTGVASAFMNNYNYGVFYGRKDDLITPIFTFTTTDSIFVKFDVAAARYFDASQTVNDPPDTLEVAITTDCGATWKVVYKKFGTQLITTNNFGTDTTYFIPNPNEWRTDSVNITTLVNPAGEFRVRIRNIENYGNNIYLDNFTVYTRPKAIPNNVGIAAIVNPTGINSLCSSSAIGVVTLVNTGSNTLSSVVFNIQVNGVSVGAVNWLGTLAPSTAVNVTLPAIIFPNAVNSLTIYTTNPNGTPDAVPANDTVKATIKVAPRVALPYTQGFESSVFPPAGWDVVQTPVDAVTWQRTTAVSKSGLASAFIDNYNYGNFAGRKDDLITPIFNFSNADSVFIKFDLAAARYFDASQTDNPNIDTLELAVSKDCGITWDVVYRKFDTTLITTNNFGTDTTFFKPTSTQWRTDSVNITNIVGTQGEFRVRIRNIENWGNNIFIDNFKVYTKVLPARLKSEGVLITPNPVTTTMFVQHLLPPIDLQGISIFNSAGQVVYRQQFFRTALTYIPINISHLAPGLYSIRLDYENNKKVSQKFIKM